MASQAEAYWVRGKRIYKTDPEIHITYVINNPERFEITKEYINDIYNKYNENVGREGKAREEIIKKVSQNGWIRVRHYTRPRDYWSIQFDKFKLREKSIKNFIEKAVLEDNIMRKDAEITLLGYADGYHKTYSWAQGGAMEFIKEHKHIEKIEMILTEFAGGNKMKLYEELEDKNLKQRFNELMKIYSSANSLNKIKELKKARKMGDSAFRKFNSRLSKEKDVYLLDPKKVIKKYYKWASDMEKEFEKMGKKIIITITIYNKKIDAKIHYNNRFFYAHDVREFKTKKEFMSFIESKINSKDAKFDISGYSRHYPRQELTGITSRIKNYGSI